MNNNELKFNNELVEIIKQVTELIRMNTNSDLDVTDSVIIRTKTIKNELKALEELALMDLPF